MKLLVLLVVLMGIGAADPLGDSIIYRTVQGLATLGILAFVWKISATNTNVKNDLQDGIKLFRKLTHRVNDHSERLFHLDQKQEAPFNEFD